MTPRVMARRISPRTRMTPRADTDSEEVLTMGANIGANFCKKATPPAKPGEKWGSTHMDTTVTAATTLPGHTH